MNAIQMPIVQTLKDRTIVIVKLVFKEMEKTVQVWDVSICLLQEGFIAIV